jgi:hypothetical protein
MSDTHDDPLLGLLTDIAEGVAMLAERIDAIEARAAARDCEVDKALATIAEIAARTYYAAKPSSSLPNDIINAGVLDAMIERWPSEAMIGMSKHDQEVLRGVGQLDTKKLDQMIVHLTAGVDQDNADRVRRTASLKILNQELDKRIKANQQAAEQERSGRGR